jgi:hypothetical protein
MEFVIVMGAVVSGHAHHPVLVWAVLLIQRMPNGTYQLILPPLPANRLLIGMMWVAPWEFVYLASIYMDDFVVRRASWP